MFFETFNDEGDREAGIVEMAHQDPTLIDALLRQVLQQIHSHALIYTKETLIALVPHLSSEDNYYNLGAVLHHIQKRCKHGEFRDVLLGNDIGNRMGAYLLAIYVKFNALKIPCPVDIPWRTLGEAVRVINALNYQEIINLCRVSTAEEIKDYIKKGRI